MALDYGLRRIGVAITDPLGITAQPLCTIERRGDRQASREIAELESRHNVTEFVVGLPLELSGKEGPAAVAVRAFIERLKRHVKSPVFTWDERMTTVEADRAISSKRRRRKKEKVIDQVAACLILQAYMDGKRYRGEL